MVLLNSSSCNFDWQPNNFKFSNLSGDQGSFYDSFDINGLLVMFICNHCPYVKAITKDLVEDCKILKKFGINSVAICANDAENYPEDSFENMIDFAKKHNFNFPYLHDETQEVAKIYGAVCTPDFF